MDDDGDVILNENGQKLVRMVYMDATVIKMVIAL